VCVCVGYTEKRTSLRIKNATYSAYLKVSRMPYNGCKVTLQYTFKYRLTKKIIRRATAIKSTYIYVQVKRCTLNLYTYISRLMYVGYTEKGTSLRIKNATYRAYLKVSRMPYNGCKVTHVLINTLFIIRLKKKIIRRATSVDLHICTYKSHANPNV